MRLLTDNWVAKIMSVLIALLLWIALVDEPEMIETVTVPVEYRNLASVLYLSPDAPNRVQLQVRGPRGRLNDVSPERTNIVLDLAAMQTASARTFAVQEGIINLPSNVTLMRAMPSQVRVKLERKLYKYLPVTVAFEVPLPPNLRVSVSSVTPASIQVVGPESRVELATSLSTEPIILTDVNLSKPIRVSVLLGDAELSIVGSAQVTVKLQTVQQP